MSASDKIIKLWKVNVVFKKEAEIPLNSGIAGKVIIPKLRVTNKYYQNSLKQSYSNLHNYHINSLTLSPDREHFISSDDLRVYLWTIENQSECYNLIDLKPPKFDDANKVITACKYHSILDYEFAYSTSQGYICRQDLRIAAKSGPISESRSENKPTIPKQKTQTLDYDELISCVTDFEYSSDGKYIFARDLLSVSVWDTAMMSEPLSTIQLFKASFDKLDALYNNEAIYDKFKISVNESGNAYATGGFNGFIVGDSMGMSAYQYFEDFKGSNPFADESIEKVIKNRQHPRYRTYIEQVIPGRLQELESDFTQRVINLAWNQKLNSVVAACKGTLYFFNRS